MTTLTRPPADPSDRYNRHPHRLRSWLLEGMPEGSGKRQGPHGQPQANHTPQPWWKVMCLTGVDQDHRGQRGDHACWPR